MKRLTLAALSGGMVLAAAIALSATGGARETATMVPAPVHDEAAGGRTSETIVLAGGCFWGVQGVFQHVEGVTSAVSGYAGGPAGDATYEAVGGGTTGHAESVEVRFDPAVVSLGTILRIYFSVAHDPTQLNRQGPDTGTQYRSAIFTTSQAQADVAKAYIAQIDNAGTFALPVVTTVGPMDGFYAAEDYHQNYATLHPDDGYIAYNDLPKIAALKSLFPKLWREEPVLVRVSAN